MRNPCFLVVLLFCYGSLSTMAGTFPRTGLPSPADSLPVPTGIRNMLFYVQRDPDANTVVYTLNQSAQGIVNADKPIQAFWIRYAEDGKRKNLTYIQNKFAYGLNTRKLAEDNFEIRFAAYDKLALYLRRGADGNYQVHTTISRKEAILDHVFVRIEGGTFWVPKVLYVELKGREAATGKLVSGRFKP
jgi:hypothetical protein